MSHRVSRRTSESADFYGNNQRRSPRYQMGSNSVHAHKAHHFARYELNDHNRMTVRRPSTMMHSRSSPHRSLSSYRRESLAIDREQEIFEIRTQILDTEKEIAHFAREIDNFKELENDARRNKASESEIKNYVQEQHSLNRYAESCGAKCRMLYANLRWLESNSRASHLERQAADNQEKIHELRRRAEENKNTLENLNLEQGKLKDRATDLETRTTKTETKVAAVEQKANQAVAESQTQTQQIATLEKLDDSNKKADKNDLCIRQTKYGSASAAAAAVGGVALLIVGAPVAAVVAGVVVVGGAAAAVLPPVFFKESEAEKVLKNCGAAKLTKFHPLEWQKQGA